MSVDTTKFTSVDVTPGTATSTAAAATINAQAGVITTEALTTAAGATYLMTLTNSYINSGSIVNVSVGRGTATGAGLTPLAVTPGTGTCAILLKNPDGSAVNGTMKIAFSVLNLS